MAEWLYEQIQQVQGSDARRRPDFAQTSALNWMKALAFEIVDKHGERFDDQWRSCETAFAEVRARANRPPLALVFEPLYASITFATSVISLAWSQSVESWRCAGAVIEWYYAVYNATRAMLTACADNPPETHLGAAGVLNKQIRRLLPHPLDMRAVNAGAEQFRPDLPSALGAQERGSGPSPLIESFDGTSRHAQEMLLSYLSGTAKYYLPDEKAKMLRSPEFKSRGFKDFRKKEARVLRDRILANVEYNFLHLAFRYRGKANYRDAVYLAYGSTRVTDARDFARDLAIVARFCAIASSVYVRARVGPAAHKQFMRDVRANFDGYDPFRYFF